MLCHISQRPDMKCRSRCTTRLLCGHNCTLICHPDEDPDHLHYTCKKDCGRICATGNNNSQTNEHRCSVKHQCYTPCPPCKKMVKRKLRCNHEMEMQCHESVDDTPCVLPCSKPLVCGHKCRGLCYEQCPPCEVRRSSFGFFINLFSNHLSIGTHHEKISGMWSPSDDAVQRNLFTESMRVQSGSYLPFHLWPFIQSTLQNIHDR